MRQLAALFSGQGSQYPGMGEELYEDYASVRRVYQCAGDILGFDVRKMSFAGSEEDLSRTIYSQPLIFTLSAAAYTAAREAVEEPVAAAGHSLGEIAALWAAGVYSLEDGFRIIAARARAMEEAAAREKGAMYAIVGLDGAAVEQICRQAGGFVFPVNYNMPTQTVISGDEESAARAARLLGEAGARKVVRLQVGGAFHTAKMAGAAETFEAEIRDIACGSPRLDFYSNLTGDKLSVQDVPAYLKKQMVSPVRFVEMTAAMERDGVEACVEYGPKKTVASFVKKNAKGITVYNVEDRKSLEKTMEALG